MDLIRRCQAGDQDAFAAVYDQYKLLVYRAADLMLNDPQEAEDMLQEVFVRVYRSLASYDNTKGAFTTWLHRITVNTCLNWHRHHQRRARLIQFDEIKAEQLAQTPTFVEGIAEDLVLRQALSQLSDKLRLVVVLHYGLGLTYAEMSQILDLPLGTVKFRVHEALNRLRVQMNSEEAILSSILPCREGNSQ